MRDPIDQIRDIIDGHGDERPELTQICDVINGEDQESKPAKLNLSDLRPMKDAPRDGKVIMACHAGDRAFYPVCWVPRNGRFPAIGNWRMNWGSAIEDDDDADYLGWIPYPELDQD